MTVKDKYADLLKLGESLNVKNGEVYEKEGKLIVKGTAEYQMEKDILWDKIKTYPDYKTDLMADMAFSPPESRLMRVSFLPGG